MVATFCYSHVLPLLFASVISFPLLANSLHIQMSKFVPGDANIVYLGSAAPQDDAIEFNINEKYAFQVGWAIYAKRVLLWDSTTGRLIDFTSHFTFKIDTGGQSCHGHGLCFFLAPFGFEIPPNSAGGFLGLFDTTTSVSSRRQIVVEFDSYPNIEWGELTEHVGINNHSVKSSVHTFWNATLHSGDTADVWINYSSTTKNLSVSWKYQKTSSLQEKTSLSYPIDLRKALPEWVTVGFSATGAFGERHTLLSWEFNSTLDKTGRSTKKIKIVVIVTVSGGVLIAVVAYALLWRKKNKRIKKESMNLRLMNDDIERGAGPRRFSYKELALATNNFSRGWKLGQGGFGAVYRGYFADLDLTVAVKKISKGSRQGRREYLSEVKIISQLRHRNLVQLMGWSHDKGEFLLVYKFMPNGSLDAHLFGKKPLSLGM